MTDGASRLYDCAVIGGGPAGLAAALYLVRFRRSVLLLDEGRSRAALIPGSHNYPGFENGVSGPAILEKLRRQLGDYPGAIAHLRVDALQIEQDRFVLICGAERWIARRVFLATGIADLAPDIDGLEGLVREGHVRFCPICDAYEARDRKIGVLVSDADAWKKALFLRTYSQDVTLMIAGAVMLSDEARRSLAEASVTLAASPATHVAKTDDGTLVRTADGAAHVFDVLYPALGCEVHSSLATTLGAKHDAVGCLLVDHHQQTSIEGLYAGGDVVSDLHQIAVALGHGAVGATAIHNSLPANFAAG